MYRELYDQPSAKCPAGSRAALLPPARRAGASPSARRSSFWRARTNSVAQSVHPSGSQKRRCGQKCARRLPLAVTAVEREQNGHAALGNMPLLKSTRFRSRSALTVSCARPVSKGINFSVSGVSHPVAPRPRQSGLRRPGPSVTVVVFCLPSRLEGLLGFHPWRTNIRSIGRGSGSRSSDPVPRTCSRC